MTWCKVISAANPQSATVLFVRRPHHVRAALDQAAVPPTNRLLPVQHERPRSLGQPVDRVIDHHVRGEDLRVAARHLQQDVAPVILEDRPVGRVVGPREQGVDRVHHADEGFLVNAHDLLT